MTDASGIRAALAACGMLLAAGCGVATEPDASGRYADPIGTAPVIDNRTPYSDELDCLRAELPQSGRPRIAVGNIVDYTGKFDRDGGRRVTQGASLMAISALDRMGMPLVERLDNSVAEAELKLANNNLIGDGGAVRQIRAGSLMGSDIFIVGGITELNYNIGSVAQDAFIDGVGVSGNAYVMNIALDLRVVDTDSMRVLDVVSYQKQILGREIRAGVFQFFDDTVFDLSVSERALEPMQLAVRAMIERAAGEMARSLFSLTSEVCAPSTEPEAAASATHEGDQT